MALVSRKSRTRRHLQHEVRESCSTTMRSTCLIQHRARGADEPGSTATTTTAAAAAPIDHLPRTDQCTREGKARQGQPYFNQFAPVTAVISAVVAAINHAEVLACSASSTSTPDAWDQRADH